VSDRSCLESKLMEAHDSTQRCGFVKSDSMSKFHYRHGDTGYGPVCGDYVIGVYVIQEG
jgi:hypothetical protein